MPIRHGRNTQLLLQRESVFRTAPAAAAFKMKFSTIDFGRDPNRQADDTLGGILQKGDDDGDATVGGSLKSILCLSDIGQWLSLLWGTPATTGAGPYTHTFTVSLADRLSALMELGYLTAGTYPQWLGVMLNSLSWDVLEGDQSMSLDLIGAEEVDPEPSAVFDAAPTEYAKNRACKKGGEIYDVDGASTLGKITQGNVSITNNLQGELLADGLEGYGDVTLGQPEISGSVTALFDSGTTIFDHGRAHTNKPMTLISTNSAGDNSLKLILPEVEFSEAKHKVETSKGLVATVDWKAVENATAAKIELLNSIVSY